MINRIVGRNQVATPSDQMGTPPEPIKSKMTNPPEPDAGMAPQLQQSAQEKAGDQRLQASRLQAELLTKIGVKNLQESGPGDETSDSQMGEILSRGAIKEAVDASLPTDSERLMKNLQESGPGDETSDSQMGEILSRGRSRKL